MRAADTSNASFPALARSREPCPIPHKFLFALALAVWVVDVALLAAACSGAADVRAPQLSERSERGSAGGRRSRGRGFACRVAASNYSSRL